MKTFLSCSIEIIQDFPSNKYLYLSITQLQITFSLRSKNINEMKLVFSCIFYCMHSYNFILIIGNYKNIWKKNYDFFMKQFFYFKNYDVLSRSYFCSQWMLCIRFGSFIKIWKFSDKLVKLYFTLNIYIF